MSPNEGDRQSAKCLEQPGTALTRRAYRCASCGFALRSSVPASPGSRTWQCADGLARRMGGSGLSPSELQHPVRSGAPSARRVPTSRAAEPYPEPRGQHPLRRWLVNRTMNATAQGSARSGYSRTGLRGGSQLGEGTLP